MNLSPDNQCTSKPRQGRGRGADRQRGGNLPLPTICNKSEKNVYVHRSSIWRALVWPRGTHTTSPIFTGRIYRELAGLDHLYFQNVIWEGLLLIHGPWCRVQPEGLCCLVKLHLLSTDRACLTSFHPLINTAKVEMVWALHYYPRILRIIIFKTSWTDIFIFGRWGKIAEVISMFPWWHLITISGAADFHFCVVVCFACLLYYTWRFHFFIILICSKWFRFLWGMAWVLTP